MHDWLERARTQLAAETGIDVSALGLDDDDVAALLDLARVAAHESGERTNAPLVCYLVGLARGVRADRRLTDLVAAVIETA